MDWRHLGEQEYIRAVHECATLLSGDGVEAGLAIMRGLAEGNPKRFLPYWGMCLNDALFSLHGANHNLVLLLDALIAATKGIKSILNGTCTSPYAFQSTSSSIRFYAIRIEQFAFEFASSDTAMEDVESLFRAVKLCGIIYSQMGQYLDVGQVTGRVAVFLRYLNICDLKVCVERTVIALLGHHHIYDLNIFHGVLECESDLSKYIYSHYYHKFTIESIPEFALNGCALRAAYCFDHVAVSCLLVKMMAKEELFIQCLAKISVNVIDMVDEEHRHAFFERLQGVNLLRDDTWLEAASKLPNLLPADEIKSILVNPSFSDVSKLTFLYQLARIGNCEFMDYISEISGKVDNVRVCQVLSFYTHNTKAFEMLKSLLSLDDPKVVWNAARALRSHSMRVPECDVVELIKGQGNIKARNMLSELLPVRQADQSTL
jgi:hypothetical protein